MKNKKITTSTWMKLLSIRTANKEEEEEEVLLVLPYDDDVIFEIFTRLPAMSLLRFRWACKYLFNLIQDPYFVKIHLRNVSSSTKDYPLVLISSRPVDAAASVDQPQPQPSNLHFHSYFSSSSSTTTLLDDDDDDDAQLVPLLDVKVPYSSNPPWSYFTILGSCNGLLCVRCYSASLRREKIFVWNPCTNEYKTVSDASIEMIRRECTIAGDILGTFVYGFGYDRSIDGYKVIRNTCFYNSDYGGETLVGVYTLGVRGTSSSSSNNSWRKVLLYGGGGSSSLGNRFYLWDSIGNEGLFINGHIYWMARSTSLDPWNMIVSFDIVKEEYKEITMLPRQRRLINPDQAASVKLLRNVHGCLCLCVIYIYFTRDQQSVDIWVMKKNKHNANIVGGGEDHISWDKLHTVSAPGLLTFRPLKFCKNGKIVKVMTKNGEVILFNSSNPTQSKQIIRFAPDEVSLTRIETYVDCLSLVSLNSGT